MSSHYHENLGGKWLTCQPDTIVWTDISERTLYDINRAAAVQHLADDASFTLTFTGAPRHPFQAAPSSLLAETRESRLLTPATVPHPDVTVSIDRLVKTDPSVSEVFTDLCDLLETPPSFRRLLEACYAVEPTGVPASMPRYSTGTDFPDLDPDIAKIWNEFVETDRRVTGLPSKNLVASWVSTQAPIAVRMNYPPDCPNPTTSIYNLQNVCIWSVLAKLGINTLDTHSAKYGMLLFDLSPRQIKKSVYASTRWHNSALPKHHVQQAVKIWDSSSARVGLLFGSYPLQTYTARFQDRIRLAGNTKWHLEGATNNVSVAVFVEYTSAELLDKQVRRLVLSLNHPQHIFQFRGHQLNYITHALLAAERLIDVATTIAFGTIPRPAFFGTSRNYYMRMPQNIIVRNTDIMFCSDDLRRKLNASAANRNALQRWMTETAQFSLEDITAFYAPTKGATQDNDKLDENDDDITANATSSKDYSFVEYDFNVDE